MNTRTDNQTAQGKPELPTIFPEKFTNKAQHSPFRLQADECLDANGFTTLRPFDGTPNGDTEAQPIATVYTDTNAKLIVASVNHADKLAEALQVALTEIKACANDCMTEAKARKWLDGNEAYWTAREALAAWEKANA